MSNLRRFDRARRFAFETPVVVGIGRERFAAVTHDVGANGLFVQTEAIGELRQLVTLEIELPFGLGTLRGHGMVVHVVPAGTPGRAAGMGIALYGLDGARRETWAAFVRKVRRAAPELHANTLRALRVERKPPAPILERYARFEDVLEVRVSMVAELVAIYERDLPRGGLSLHTDHTIEVGDGFVLRIVHPRRRDSLSVPCRVRRAIRDDAMRGLDAEFLDLDDNARALFWEFIGAQIVEVDDAPVVLVDESA